MRSLGSDKYMLAAAAGLFEDVRALLVDSAPLHTHTDEFVGGWTTRKVILDNAILNWLATSAADEQRRSNHMINSEDC